MKSFLRLFGFLRPHWRLVAVTALCVTLFASFSGVSILAVSPFVRILFDDRPAAAEAPQGGTETERAPAWIPLPGAAREWVRAAQRRAEGFLMRGSRTQALGRLCVILLLLFLAKNVTHYAQTYFEAYLEQSVLRDVRNRVYAHVSEVPLGTYVRQRTGTFISRIVNDVGVMRIALVGGLLSLLRNSLMMLIARLGKRLRSRSGHAQERMADMASVVQETVSGARIVKAFGMHAFELGRFARFNAGYFKSYIKVRRLQAMAGPVSEMLAIVGVVAILWFGGRLVIQGQLPLDRMFLFVTAMIWLAEPVKALIGVHNSMQEGLAAADRVFALLDMPTEPPRHVGRAARFEKVLQFDGVGFAYDLTRPVLRDVDVSVRPGQVVALVGPSGAGKSTFVDLIPRFYEVTSGRILMDGVDVRELSLDSLRQLVGMVTQEVILFNDTVRANIAYGAPDIDEERIVAAARAANAHDFILQLPDGYDTTIGERGVMLSGGERQRLSIARAILRDPRILIFDEATSSLDSRNEQLIQEAIERLVRGRTTLVVAHRLSTVQRADVILVFESGRIVERGTHNDLVAAAGPYAKLHQLQFG
jgi:subfamily B ATP-binding cassette protein MsbA